MTTLHKTSILQQARAWSTPLHHCTRQLQFCLVLSSIKTVPQLILFILLLPHIASPHILLLPRQCLPQHIHCHQQTERIKGGLYKFCIFVKSSSRTRNFLSLLFYYSTKWYRYAEVTLQTKRGEIFSRKHPWDRMCLLSIHRSIDPTAAPFIVHRSHRNGQSCIKTDISPGRDKGVMTDSDSILHSFCNLGHERCLCQLVLPQLATRLVNSFSCYNRYQQASVSNQTESLPENQQDVQWTGVHTLDTRCTMKQLQYTLSMQRATYWASTVNSTA